MICFYHSADLDGKCSAAIVRHFADRRGESCEFYGIDYGEPFPWEKAEGRDVVMVDFCLQPIEDMIQLKERVASLIWIDHHISHLREAELLMLELEGLQMEGAAACELTWKYYVPDPSEPPRAVWLLGRYDVWDLDAAEDVLPFQYGMRLMANEPDSPIWPSLFSFDAATYEITRNGNTILQYQAQQNNELCDLGAFEAELDGLRCICLNMIKANSQVFESLWNREKYDAMLAFGWKKNRWEISLYSDRPEIDVSEICVARGGGGHRGAAGFNCEYLPESILK